MARKSGYRFSEKAMHKVADGGSLGRRGRDALFHDFTGHNSILLAISGGPDSTALLVLAARWRDAQKKKPKLIAATVNHGLRKDAKAEAAGVAKLARKLKVPHRILGWRGKKPKTGLQEAARIARYELLLSLARETKCTAIVTAHTRDDQAETVLHRIGRGSGITGLAGIRPQRTRDGMQILRPLLGVSKVQLMAFLHKEKIAYAIDPTNADPRYLRSRLRSLAPLLAKEGIDAAKLAQLARRLYRADTAIEAVVNEAQVRASRVSNEKHESLDARLVFRLPEEIGLRLLRRAINRLGHEGPAELGKLEALFAALKDGWRGRKPVRRTLAGALLDLSDDCLTVEPAPVRRRARKTQGNRR
jgi:tRNA(Ile)-lysidine synthase